MKPIVIIDNGHGSGTAGKSSPDGRYREWTWSRCAAAALDRELRGRGIATHILVPELLDVPLGERCRRANEIYLSNGAAILISLHSNASGDGRAWGEASGWSAWVSRNASQSSRRLASLLTAEARRRGLLGNRATPPAGYWTAGLAICRDTLCPAALTENMFHDNRGDVEFLLSDRGLQTIAELHAEAVCRYFNLK